MSLIKWLYLRSIIDNISHAVGMAIARSLGFEIDFVRNPISGSAARFFVIILKFILRPIYEIKISEKNFLSPK